MAKTVMRVKGLDGEVELLTDRVIIHRKGLWNALKYGLSARKEIPLAAVTQINFRDATPLTFGDIDFAYAGRSQIDQKQNTVKFGKRKQMEFLRLKEKIFEMMSQGRRQ